jgi:hypothetical protein
MSDSATTPQQTALLVAVPVDEDGFRGAWRRGSDYLRQAYADLDSGWHAYGKTAHLARTELADCEALGASVVLEATLKNFAEQTWHFPVIVVIAHMEFPLVMHNDVLDAERLCFMVEHGTEPEWAMIRAECNRPFEVQEAVTVMNRLLKATQRDLGAAPIEDIRESDRVARHRSSGFGLLRLDRPRLDELCGPTVLREGKGIELADGMISAREFIQAIPIEYNGLIDLRMCNSISLGAAIRRARKGVRAAVGKQKTYPDAAVVLYKTAILYMMQQAKRGCPMPYEEVMQLFGGETR